MNIKDYCSVTDRITPSERCREEVLSMNKRQKKNIRLTKRGIAAAAAVAIAACGGTAVFAADRAGVFDRMSRNIGRTTTLDSGEEVPAIKENSRDYEQIASAAADADVGFGNDAVSLSIESIYCDGEKIIFGLSGSMNDGNKAGWGYVHLWDVTLSIGERSASAEGFMVIDEDEVNSFTGTVTCILPEEMHLTEAADVTLRLNEIKCCEKYWMDTTSIGSAETTVTVTPENDLIQPVMASAEEDGWSFKVYSIDPVMMTAGWSFPEEYSRRDPDSFIGDVQKDYWGNIISGTPKYSIIAMVYDADGNRLTRVLDHSVDIDGTAAETFLPPTTDTIIVKFCNKQQSDENGMPVVMKELELRIRN